MNHTIEFDVEGKNYTADVDIEFRKTSYGADADGRRSEIRVEYDYVIEEVVKTDNLDIIKLDNFGLQCLENAIARYVRAI